MITAKQFALDNIERIQSLSEGKPGSLKVILILIETLGEEAIEALNLLEQQNIKGTEITRLFRENDHDSFKLIEILRSKKE